MKTKICRYPEVVRVGLRSYLHNYLPKAEWKIIAVSHAPGFFNLEATVNTHAIAHAFLSGWNSAAETISLIGKHLL